MHHEMIQSIIFNKNLNTLDYCLKWLIDNDYKIKKIDETNNYYRFRQLEPSLLKKQGYNIYRNKLIDINKKIYLIIAYNDSLIKNKKLHIINDDDDDNIKIYNSMAL